MVMSLLGDAEGKAPGDFAVLNAKMFEGLGRWEKEKGSQSLMYDFWYQPRHNDLISSEWAAPHVVEPGFKVEDVKIDIAADGRMRLDPKFFVSFDNARSHEVRFPDGDPISEIWAQAPRGRSAPPAAAR